MRRFFFDPSSRNGDKAFLSEEESRHISKVLRLKTGDEIELLDGLGTLYHAVITTVGRQVEAQIEGVVVKEADVGKSVLVWQGILKGEKMDTVVQKCTELGVTEMMPFQSSRCQGKLSRIQARKKHQRWQRIGQAACKQCLRLQSIKIDTPVTYTESLSKKSDDNTILRLLFWEEEKTTHLHDIPNIAKACSLALMLGPEGGFTREEVEQARLSGWRTVSLGDRILRAETATLSAVSIVQYLAGNL
ncbi:MAG: 16S rRNA (uracil(1498)-N(3))-methyltransferase [Desulforhopalus sp.]|nr:16S rRNA (uracil(1498)-N(3))-methyltransferase [Desulforhopalus sp.]